MSILDPENIDTVGVAEDHIALMQFDPLEWGGVIDDEEHINFIEGAINTCLAYYDSGQLEKDYPEDAHLPVKIVLVPTHPLSEVGMKYIEFGKPIVRKAGLELVVDANYGLDEQ